MANRDNRKNKHNRGGFKSIGSQVGSDLGGHLSNQGKLGGGGKKGGNFSFSDFSNFVGNFFTKPGYAETMGNLTGNITQLNQPSAWKTKQFADKNIDITKMNPSFRFNIDTQGAINNIDNEKVRNWLNKYTPQSVKDLKINHQMYSPTKLMPGDKGYKPTGTGSIQLDPETERYLEWMATHNPEGYTISDFEKMYARNLKDGRHTLEQVMKMNRGNTIPYHALIDDKTPPEKTNNNNDMTINYTDNQKKVQDLYGTLLGRQAADEGMSYWSQQLDKGKTVEDVVRGIQSGSEYLARKNYMTANPNATESDLDANISPGGGTRDPNNPDAAPTFAANNTWSAPLQSTSDQHHDELAAVVNQLGGYDTRPNPNLGAFVPGVTHNPAGGPITPDAPAAAPAAPANPSGYLTMDDLTSFFNERDAAKNDSGGMDEFMKFMMLMSVMPRGGGGYGGGGSQYGYGGLNPGGVQAAYNPWENMKTGWDFMKNNFGSGSSSSPTTALTNAS
jgi:hypothetical protein